ncbi:MAG: DNA polymerase III subunit beta [Deltaproteobacteria bacterium]|nr:DNA polymerase III subunit beta [Deltaproteobacteria bacterium]
MDLTILKSELSKALFVTESIVEKRTTMPILSNVLLSAADGKLKISATDLEVTALATATAKVKSPGSTTVNAKVFSDIVRELPDAEVTLKLGEGERLEIISKGSRLKMIGVSAEEFPSLPGVSFEARSKISSKQLSEMVNKTVYAVSYDETRFNLNGVCFELVGESKGKGKKGERSLRFVATDGHRLAMITRPVADLDFEERVIVPRKGLSEIRKLITSDDDVQVGLDIRDGFLLLETAAAKVSMRLIDGEFPDYNQVLPKQPGVVVSLNISDFSQALRRVALMVTDKGKCVRLDFSQNSLRISSSSPELGEAVEELEVKYSGKPLSVGFNAKYILDITASLGEAQKINLELNGELGPGKFFADGDESYIGIVMPMRLTAA